jgi:simple sugar transport system ATP-binding protein
MRNTVQVLDETGAHVPSVDTPVANLSSGQGQATPVAHAVRQENINILPLDEPLVAVDAKLMSPTIGLIKILSVKSNISIIVICYNSTHRFEISDRINVIQQGRVTMDKSLSEIKLEELSSWCRVS